MTVHLRNSNSKQYLSSLLFLSKFCKHLVPFKGHRMRETVMDESTDLLFLCTLYVSWMESSLTALFATHPVHGVRGSCKSPFACPSPAP